MLRTSPRMLLMLLAAAAWQAGPLAAQELKIATLAPEGSDWMVAMRAGAGEIEQRSEGRVNFKFYGGGVQGNDNQVRRKMRIGQVHGGTFTSGTIHHFDPSAQLYSMPMVFNNFNEVMYVRAHLDPKIRQRLEDRGFVNFGFTGAGFGYLMSQEPVRTLADMEGEKTWVQEGDTVAYAAFKSLGISPVTMPLTDVLTGLQTGLLDSASISPVGALVLQWHTKLRYISNLPLAYVYGTLLIDRRPFSRLSPADQALVREVMERIYSSLDGKSNADNESSLRALQGSGLQLIEPDREEVARWREVVFASNREQVRQGAVDSGLMREMLDLLADYRAQLGQ